MLEYLPEHDLEAVARHHWNQLADDNDATEVRSARPSHEPVADAVALSQLSDVHVVVVSTEEMPAFEAKPHAFLCPIEHQK